MPRVLSVHDTGRNSPADLFVPPREAVGIQNHVANQGERVVQIVGIEASGQMSARCGQGRPPAGLEKVNDGG
jgi:hypothetical protein